MSTIPGHDAERDAGLRGPELTEPLNLTEALDTDQDGKSIEDPLEAEEHKPGPARPDQDGTADEADVLEQLAIEPDDADDGL